ncbi:(2Fe-2S)-binding protein (plasmid) [Microvirga sp. VF16]|nr:(2Fe-2S)-binding protein [Microvirga sp. VF16]
MMRIPGLPDGRRDQGYELLRCRQWPDGWRNRLYDPVRYVGEPEAVQRMRRVCCLRHRLPGVAACSGCPNVKWVER